MLDETEKAWIMKIVSQLEVNPFAGKPLGFRWFREKKFKGKRLYYLIYEKIGKVLLVAFGGKKEQRKLTSHILGNLDRYRAVAEAL